MCNQCLFFLGTQLFAAVPSCLLSPFHSVLLSVALVDEVGPTYRLEGAALLDGCLLSSGGKE
ncbi:hypothetical protein U0070_024893, partial [Myodes glareolus]